MPSAIKSTDNHSKPKVFAVVPAFNESKNIVRVIEELKNVHFDSYDFDFVVVDDGSKDDTSEVAKNNGATVVSLPYNMGIGMTVQTGFRFAVEHDADFVVQVDGDGQHVPSEISKLLNYYETNKADVVVGTRFLSKKHKKEGIQSTTTMRWLAGRALAWTVRVLTKQKITDTTSGFRLYSRNAAKFVAHQYPDDYPEVEVLVILARHGFKISEVAVQMRSREHGQSSINWWRSIYYVFKVVFASFMDRVR